MRGGRAGAVLVALVLAACGSTGEPLEGETGGAGGGRSGPLGPGPWPDEPLVNYTERYGLGRVRSVGLDEGHHLWLLDGERVGVLAPGARQAVWASRIGQAREGFGPDRLALGSTVICGGASGQAYVGYAADTRVQPVDAALGAFVFSPDGCAFPGYSDCDPSRFSPLRFRDYQKGDLDLVRLGPGGAPELDEHLHRSATQNPFPGQLGLRNTNDHHFDEDRSVLSCVRATRGPARGDVFIGTNHGYTRIRGRVYNSHRHPIWLAGTSVRAGEAHGLGIAQDGDVLMASDWSVGIVSPTGELASWDREGDAAANPEKLKNVQVLEVNGREAFDHWRGFQQTVDGTYYLGSRDFGLWKLTVVSRTEGRGERVGGVPARVAALAATGDGSLFAGTDQGLWRLDAQKRVERLAGIPGAVRQLVYDDTVRPAMLLVLLESGELYVLRGH